MDSGTRDKILGFWADPVQLFSFHNIYKFNSDEKEKTTLEIIKKLINDSGSFLLFFVYPINES